MVDLVPTINVIVRNGVDDRQVLNFYRYSGRTDEAGTLAVYEVEEARGLDGEITGWRTKPKGKQEIFAQGEWQRLSSEWVEEVRETEGAVH